MPESELPGDEMLDKETRRFYMLIDQVNDLTKAVQEVIKSGEGRQVQTVIHKTAGMQPLIAIAIVACLFTWVLMIVLAVIFVPDIHDLQAWHDIDRKDIARLQAQQNK